MARSGPRSNGQKSRDFLAVVGLLRSENAPISLVERQDDEEEDEEEEVFYTNVLRYLCTGFREIWNKLRGKLRILACPDSDSFLSISFGAVQIEGEGSESGRGASASKNA